jgi:hypothetical protein
MSSDVSEEHLASIEAKQKTRDLLANSFHAGFLLGLFFDPEDGGDMFLRNVG